MSYLMHLKLFGDHKAEISFPKLTPYLDFLIIKPLPNMQI